jgi:hypothetical protein
MSSEEAPESDAGSEAEEVGGGFGVVAGGRWTSDEDAAIRAGVEARRPWKEISDGLPGRTFYATKTRGERLGLKQREGFVPWTTDEDAAIRTGVEARRPWKEISDGIPGRTFSATKAHGERLGMKRLDRWTAEEDATLRAGVEAGEPWKTLAERLPSRTVQASRYRASQIGIERSEKQVHVAWTEAEDEEIRAGVAAGETNEEIAKRLPGRTLDAVKHRRTALRDSLRGEGESVTEPWTEAENAALRKGFASGKSWKELAKDFPGRTKNAVKVRGRQRFMLRRDSDAAA